jgi:hypothetical protein
MNRSCVFGRRVSKLGSGHKQHRVLFPKSICSLLWAIRIGYPLAIDYESVLVFTRTQPKVLPPFVISNADHFRHVRAPTLKLPAMLTFCAWLSVNPKRTTQLFPFPFVPDLFAKSGKGFTGSIAPFRSLTACNTDEFVSASPGFVCRSVNSGPAPA